MTSLPVAPMIQSHAGFCETAAAQRFPHLRHRQPDHEGALQDALSQLKTMTIEPRCTGASGQETYPCFIPMSDLQTEFTKPEKIEELLKALIKNTFQHTQYAHKIRHLYLRPFMILICAGHGNMILHFMKHQSLQDDRLPFRGGPPDGFPISSGSDLIWQKFNEHQWKFCAMDMRYNMDLELSKDDLLPIVSKEILAGGASATTSKVQIHPDYDKLRDGTARLSLNAALNIDNDKATQSDARSDHIYVLKTYNTPQAKNYHEAEKNAFQMLDKGPNGQENNIISYYGSFAQKNDEKT